MMGLLEMIFGRALERLREEGEDELAEEIVDDHREEIVSAYNTARAAGATEQEACLAGARRLITHAL